MKTVIKAGNMLNPTPVVLVSCGTSPDEYNLLTIAWTGTINSDPPMCYISVRPQRYSHPIIKRNGEFVINLVSSKMAEQTDWCGVTSGKKVNKFIESNFTPVKASKIHTPLVFESPVNIECIVKQVLSLGSHDMFIAEIVAVNVDNYLIDKKTGELQLYKANLISYSHGHYYSLGKILGKFGYSVQKKQ